MHPALARGDVDDGRRGRLRHMDLLGRGPDGISPTAHYTGEVWSRHGLGHQALRTVQGRLMVDAMRPLLGLSRLVGGPTLDGMLLGRHRVIDAHLEEAIDAGRVGQVVELAAGMSPRGLRFADRVEYLEVDLPAMADRKRRALDGAGASHRVAGVDVTADGALEALFARLDRTVGVAVVTEGLLNYLPEDVLVGLWRDLGRELRGFRHGLYLSDLAVDGGASDLVARGFTTLLGLFVGGHVSPHFNSDAEAEETLRAAGFHRASVRPAAEHPAAANHAQDPGARLIRVVVASTA
jgi:O-methyltransferase involved in polyketide biosynthesis